MRGNDKYNEPDMLTLGADVSGSEAGRVDIMFQGLILQIPSRSQGHISQLSNAGDHL